MCTHCRKPRVVQKYISKRPCDRPGRYCQDVHEPADARVPYAGVTEIQSFQVRARTSVQSVGKGDGRKISNRIPRRDQGFKDWKRPISKR